MLYMWASTYVCVGAPQHMCELAIGAKALSNESACKLSTTYAATLDKRVRAFIMCTACPSTNLWRQSSKVHAAVSAASEQGGHRLHRAGRTVHHAPLAPPTRVP